MERYLVEEANYEAIEHIDPVDQAITWSASEFIAHEKNAGWYGTLALVTAIAAATAFLLTKGDVITVAMVVIVAIFFGVYAARKPRQLPYMLDVDGLQIGDRYYPLQQFRSFAVVPEGAFSSIILMPLRRFAPMTTIYYAPGDEEQILAILSVQLPYAEHRHDAIDRLMRHIRF